MKKILLLIGLIFCLSACKQGWEPVPYAASFEIIKKSKDSAVIEYQNEYGIGYTDHEVDMPEELSLNPVPFFGKGWPNETCLDDNPAKQVPLVSWHRKCPLNVTGCGGSDRFALICGDRYMIREFTLANGPQYYGPFDLQNHSLIEAE